MLRRKFATFISALLIILGALSTRAFAYDWFVTAHVTLVEGSYMPTSLPFSIDTAGSSSCPAGALLSWVVTGPDELSQIANATAVYSLLLTALTVSRQVQVYGFNSGCKVGYIHII